MRVWVYCVSRLSVSVKVESFLGGNNHTHIKRWGQAQVFNVFPRLKPLTYNWGYMQQKPVDS